MQFVLFLLLTAFIAPLRADTTTGATFLKIGGGAEPTALGNAYGAVAGDVESMYYNPGGMASLDSRELTATHSEWVEDTAYDLVSYGQPTKFGTFGVSALRLGGGDEDGRDANRQVTGTFSSDDVSGLLSYSHKVTDFVGVGANAKFLDSQIDATHASTYAFDVGSVGRVPGIPLWLGFSAMNLGSGLRFIDQVDRLPLTFDLGGAWRPRAHLALTTDVTDEPYDSRVTLHGGVEATLSIFQLRLGYQGILSGTSDGLDTTNNISGGIGLQVSRYRADYTLAPFGDLGLTQRFSLSVLFDIPTSNERLNLHSPEELP